MKLHYQLDGPQDAPVIVLSNSLGTTLEMWDAQIPALTRDFRVLRYDTHGHGQTTQFWQSHPCAAGRGCGEFAR